MKRAFFFLPLLILSFNTQAQKITSRQSPHKRHMCATTIVGISSLTVGTGMAIGGLLMEWGAGATYEHSISPNKEAEYQHDNNTAIAVRDVGIGLFAAGLGMTIAGAIHDHSKHNNKWAIVAPKKNEMGIAFNF